MLRVGGSVPYLKSLQVAVEEVYFRIKICFTFVYSGQIYLCVSPIEIEHIPRYKRKFCLFNYSNPGTW